MFRHTLRLVSGKKLVLFVFLSFVLYFGFAPLPYVSLQHASAAVNIKEGNFTKKTSAGLQSITGIGFKPKVVIFFWTSQVNQGTDISGDYYGTGFITSSSSARSVATWSTLATTSNTGHMMSDTRSIIMFTGNGTISGAAQPVSLDADGFTLNWTIANSSAYSIHYIALGGTDITDAQSGTFGLQTGTGNQVVTGVGFQPGFVMLISGKTNSLDTNVINANYSLGFASDVTHQAVIAEASQNNLGTTDTCSQQRTDMILSILATNCASNDTLASLTSFNADGFTINKSIAPSATKNVFYLAIKGGQFRVGSFNKPTFTSNQTISGLGFQPTGLFLASRNKTQGTSISADAYISLGAAQSATQLDAISSDDSSADSTPSPKMRSMTNKIFTAIEGDSPTLTGEANLNKFTADGFKLNWTSADSSSDQLLYWAVGNQTFINQTAYQWFNNTDSLNPTAVESNPTINADRAFAVLKDPAAEVVYVVGFQGAPQTTAIQIEKRNTLDGALVSGFGTNGIITGSFPSAAFNAALSGSDLYIVGLDGRNGGVPQWRIEKRSAVNGSLVYEALSSPSPSDAEAKGVAIDPYGGAMYVVGYDTAPGNEEWRLEKRNLSDGSLIFATSTNPSSSNDRALSISLATSTGAIFIGGYDGDPSATKVHIEKRSMLDGSLVTSFGNGGVVLGTFASAIQSVQFQADPLGGDVVYAAGLDANAGSVEWRIEKRNAENGSLIYVVTSNPTAFSDQTASMELDVASGVMYLTGSDQLSSTPDGEWRIEKRNLADGSLLYATTTNPTVNNDEPQFIAIDSVNGFMYVTGWKNEPNDVGWRLEKRNLSDGSLVWGSPLAVQNTPAIAPVQRTPFRLRMLLQPVGRSLTNNSPNFKLQLADKGATASCSLVGTEMFSDITASSSLIRYYNNPTPADGSLVVLSSTPKNGTDTMVGETYVESTIFTAVNTVASGQDGQWDFALVNNSAPAASTYCFRIIKSDGSLLDSYQTFPEITTP